jgi:hypothetical protein
VTVTLCADVLVGVFDVTVTLRADVLVGVFDRREIYKPSLVP